MSQEPPLHSPEPPDDPAAAPTAPQAIDYSSGRDHWQGPGQANAKWPLVLRVCGGMAMMASITIFSIILMAVSGVEGTGWYILVPLAEAIGIVVLCAFVLKTRGWLMGALLGIVLVGLLAGCCGILVHSIQ
jgi:hypothetical protein